MEAGALNLLRDINQAIIKFRGTYSEWSTRHGISYNEMLVLYTIRESGCCTQKQICDSYLLPKQTIHNVIASLRGEGILEMDKTRERGREKTFVLSDKGKSYAAPFLKSLDEVESRALETLGEGKLASLTMLLLEYDAALKDALVETR